MKILFYTLIIVWAYLFPNVLNAQKLTTETYKLAEIEKHKKIVNEALVYKDGSTAINSLHNIITLEGETSTYKDTLAITYYNVGNYMSCHLLTKELLVKQPTNIKLLEINAFSLQQLNAPKEAITAFEALFAQTNNMSHGYQLAVLQAGIKRLVEAQVTLNKTLLCQEIPNAFSQFPLDKNQNQNVPLKAAVYNLKALVAYELKAYNEAVQAFADALKIMPEFRAATQNANALTIELQNMNNK